MSECVKFIFCFVENLNDAHGTRKLISYTVRIYVYFPFIERTQDQRSGMAFFAAQVKLWKL